MKTLSFPKPHSLRIVIPFFLVFIAACSTVQPPATLVTQAQERVRQAESVGADEAAPLVLREARQQLTDAERAMQKEEFEEARLLLEKSLINSELAIAQTNASSAEKAAEEIEKNLDLLRREATPNSQSNSYSYE